MTHSAQTQSQEALDQFARRIYGEESGYVEALLDANPGLAALPKRLPFGTVIQVPHVAPPDAGDPVVKLWD